MNRFTAAALLGADSDREVALGDARVTILASAVDTDGAVAVLDYRMPPHYVGPPTHVHPAFDEILSVLEGTSRFVWARSSIRPVVEARSWCREPFRTRLRIRPTRPRGSL